MTVLLFDPLAHKRRFTHKAQTTNDYTYTKTIEVADYSALVDDSSAINFNGTNYFFYNDPEDTDTQIEISVVSNTDQAQKIYSFLQPLVEADDRFISISRTNESIRIKANFDFDFIGLSADDALSDSADDPQLAPPTGDQIFIVTKEIARLLATSQVNVHVDTSAVDGSDNLNGKCKVNFWIYDDLLKKWSWGESDSYPQTDRDNLHAAPYKYDNAGQTWGITISELEGTNARVSITGCNLPRITGGN